MSLRTTKAELRKWELMVTPEIGMTDMEYRELRPLIHDALKAHKMVEALRHVEGILPMCEAIGYKYGKVDAQWNRGTGIPYYEPQLKTAIDLVRAALGMDV